MDLRHRQKAVRLAGLRLKRRTTFAQDRFSGEHNGGAKLTRSEGVESAEAAIQLSGGQAPFAVEPAEKVLGLLLPLL